MKKNAEIRCLHGAVTIRTASNGDRILSGLIPYNSRSVDLGGFVEEIKPGAFSRALAADADVLALRDHKQELLMGRTKSKTMTLEDSAEGLKYSIRLPKSQAASDLAESVDRGDLDAASFGFVCCDGGDKWTREARSQNVRELHEVELYEISPCSFAAYPASSASLRSAPPEIRSALRGHTEKRHLRLMSAVTGSRWAIKEDKLQTICAVLAARAAGTTMSPDEIRAAMMGVASSEPQTVDSVAIIPVYGTISNRANLFSEFSGGTSIQGLTAAFRAALADDSVKTIVFDVDSPGGTVDGVPEFAAEILAARDKKPSIAVANTQAASAAMWIASAAGKLVVAPSGEVGSIGVYMMHEDWSAALEKEGVDVTFIKAGKYKTEGNPCEPLSSATEEYWQKGVDTTYDEFVAAVAAGRGCDVAKVEADFGQSRMVMSADALAVGMVDEIATLDQVLASLGTSDPRTNGKSPYADSNTISAPIIDPDENEDNSGEENLDGWRNHIHCEIEVRQRRMPVTA